MNVFFRKLPLTLKLLLIGIIPILFLIYFSVIIYREKAFKVQFIGNYLERIDQSAKITDLITQLGRERRAGYLYILKNEGYDKVLLQRKSTDSIINELNKSIDFTIRHFTDYTFLNNLPEIRTKIDRKTNISSDDILQFYTDAIVRLNTINATVPANTFLKPIYQDLIAQKLLSEILTYFQIIRSGIFNALYTQENMSRALYSQAGIYRLMKSYETEFLIKASPLKASLYMNRKKLTDLSTVSAYLERLFTTFKFDRTFDADQWWDISSKAALVLRDQERDLWETVNAQTQEIYDAEKNSRNVSAVLIIVAVLFVIGLVAYIINDITRLLSDIKMAARKISKGATDIQLLNMPTGVIGNLAKSIKEIDKNNILLAEAASLIGKGNFEIPVQPRSNEDLLSQSIRKMQQDLREFSMQKDRIQKETEELVYKRDEFFSVASHELKTPVTSLKAYTQLLLMNADIESPQNKKMLERMNVQINKLTLLINDLLDTSKLQNGQLAYRKEDFRFDSLVEEIIEEIQPTSYDTEIIFQPHEPVEIYGDRDRIGQVISNLLVNAIKYAPQSKQVWVELEKNGDDYLRCAVRDFGSGILPEEHNKIFERFYRIAGNNLNTYPGLGLGLFLSKEIIEKHGGRIWLESEKDKGTTFYFELPLLTNTDAG